MRNIGTSTVNLTRGRVGSVLASVALAVIMVRIGIAHRQERERAETHDHAQ